MLFSIVHVRRALRARDPAAICTRMAGRIGAAALLLGSAACGDEDASGSGGKLAGCVEIAATIPFVELATLGGSLAIAHDVNALGQATGVSLDAKGQAHAVVWSEAGSIRDIGTLPGRTGSEAWAINDAGDVAGQSAGGEDGPRAFLWTAAGALQDLGTLGSDYSGAAAMNNRREIVGGSQTTTGHLHAFLWSAAGGMRDLGTLPGSTDSDARGINERGDVVGSSFTSAGQSRAFIWTAAAGMRELKPPAGVNAATVAVAINAAGTVVGYMSGQQGVRALLWDASGAARELGTIGGPMSEADDINDCGQVIGTSQTAAGAIRPFVWTEAGGMKELSAPDGARTASGEALGRRGHAVGQAEDAGGVKPVRWKLGG